VKDKTQEDRIKKVIAWRVCSISITMMTTWLYTGSIKEATVFTGMLHVILMAAHYLFEATWEKYESR